MLGFLNSAMASATQRYISYSEGQGVLSKKTQIFNISLILHFVIALIVGVVLLGIIPVLFGSVLNIENSRLFAAKIVYFSLIASTMLTVMTVPYDAMLNSHENMLYYSLVGMLESFLKLAVAFIVVYTKYDKLVVYGILMACIPFITLTIMRVYCHRHYQECVFAPIKYWDYSLLKEMTSFAGWNFVSSFISFLSGYGSNILLNYFFGTTLNASYGVSRQIDGQLQAFGNNMMKAINPVIVKKEGAKDRVGVYAFAFSGCKISVMIYALLALPLLVNIEYILKIWLVQIPPYAVTFCQLIVIKLFFFEVGASLGTVINAIGKIKWFNIIVSVNLLVNIVLVFAAFKLGFPPYSFLLVSMFADVVGLINKVYFCVRLGNMPCSRYVVDVLFKSMFPVALIYFVISLSHYVLSDSLVKILLTSCANVLLILLSFYYFTFNDEEKSIVNKLFVSIKKKIL